MKAKTYFKTFYDSPLGKIILISDTINLVGLGFEGQKYFDFSEVIVEKDDLQIFIDTKIWLNRYFRGEKPLVSELSLVPIGNEFRRKVWGIISEIPYGEITTYGEIAKKIAKQRGAASMSAQAVGGAIGHNPISIIIPCHRVVGKNKKLTGYAGGISRKFWLLEHEGVELQC